jgi:hypothetical protein
MKARIKVRSFHWEIVKRIEAPENIGDNKTVATPSCDAGIVWTITLEGVD